ncbi:MAG TPA: hypothetical protein PK878_08670 [bacterium]|nr:hypothetical protein [Candidatus Omnitrophota bacterium]HOJ60348.1 hypothetical protein [bacterium]HXK95986.1 hypothetical protein [bacterium]
MKKLWLSSLLVVCSLGIALPVISSETIAPSGNSLNEAVKAELQQAKERQPQAVCPISGKPVSGKDSTTYLGYEIKTCCPNCIDTVKKDPLAAIQALRKKGQEPALADNMKLQTVCPISGKPVTTELYAIKNNILVQFCCPNCPAAFQKDPKGTVEKMLGQGIAPILLTFEQKECPVSHEPVSGNSSVVHEGKVIELCCDACKAQVLENPEKVIQDLADQGIVLAREK